MVWLYVLTVSACVAGQGEACSHVTALLFTLEANSQVQKSLSCTSLPCYWLPPTFRTVPFARICDIDFTAPQKKHMKVLEDAQATSTSNVTLTVTSTPSFNMKPSASELNNFYKTLSETGKPAILSIVPDFSEAYVPLQVNGDLSSPLTNKELLSLTYTDLLSECEKAYQGLSISSEQAKLVQNKTRAQSKSKIWFKQRAGRITASRFKAAASTDISQPCQSLIKGICYPESCEFSSKATKWGCQHERIAIETYTKERRQLHSGFSVSCSGLVINTSYPHMGASPDGIIKCNCCGTGVLEVKCSFSCTDQTFLKATSQSGFFVAVKFV